MKTATKILSGRELAGFIKERQVGVARNLTRRLGRAPRLLIIRDSDDPVITKYVELKRRYGADIGVAVEDFCAGSSEEIAERIKSANRDADIDGVILQLPVRERERTDELTGLISGALDVDGLSGRADAYDSATATAILWLLAGYDIVLKGVRVAIVGRGKLVGAPLYRMLSESGVDVELLHKGDDLTKLTEFDIIISATGVPGLIVSAMIKSGAVVIDAGTASEKGVLLGDIADEVREREDLAAITPRVGGVGPLTVTCLFEHVLNAASLKAKKFKDE